MKSSKLIGWKVNKLDVPRGFLWAMKYPNFASRNPPENSPNLCVSILFTQLLSTDFVSCQKRFTIFTCARPVSVSFLVRSYLLPGQLTKEHVGDLAAVSALMHTMLHGRLNNHAPQFLLHFFIVSWTRMEYFKNVMQWSLVITIIAPLYLWLWCHNYAITEAPFWTWLNIFSMTESNHPEDNSIILSITHFESAKFLGKKSVEGVSRRGKYMVMD